LRAVLTSFGSTGDAQPFLALAAELRRRGHRPVLALSPNFAPHAEQLGLEFAPLGPELRLADIRGVITTQLAMSNPIDQARHFLETVMPIMPGIFHQLREICRTADVVISSPHQFAGRMVHEAIDIPLVSVHLSHFGALGSRDLRDASAPVINEFRAREGLPPLHDPLTVDAVSTQLALYAVSRFILRRPVQWPAQRHVTGFFYLEDEQWQPPAPLVEFMAAGEPPVVITFGSVVHDDPDALTRLVLEVIAAAKCRAIVQHGWSGLARQPLPDNVYAAGYTPHSWLFPQAACVVHHGGAGTTAAALRAGVPTVVIPHTLDQPIWAEFARALGCAASVIPYPQLTSRKLSEGITKCLSVNRYRQAAAKLGEQVRTEQGVLTACQLIEQLVQSAEATDGRG
jgi:UDP:flavonoid glycosyltransferase YjiC (YdhE family)